MLTTTHLMQQKDKRTAFETVLKKFRLDFSPSSTYDVAVNLMGTCLSTEKSFLFTLQFHDGSGFVLCLHFSMSESVEITCSSNGLVP